MRLTLNISFLPYYFYLFIYFMEHLVKESLYTSCTGFQFAMVALHTDLDFELFTYTLTKRGYAFFYTYELFKFLSAVVSSIFVWFDLSFIHLLIFCILLTNTVSMKRIMQSIVSGFCWTLSG